jgi:hypothetical protein
MVKINLKASCENFQTNETLVRWMNICQNSENYSSLLQFAIETTNFFYKRHVLEALKCYGGLINESLVEILFQLLKSLSHEENNVCLLYRLISLLLFRSSLQHPIIFDSSFPLPFVLQYIIIFIEQFDKTEDFANSFFLKYFDDCPELCAEGLSLCIKNEPDNFYPYIMPVLQFEHEDPQLHLNVLSKVAVHLNEE